VQAVSWRWIFYVNLPIGLVAMVVLRFTLPTTQARSKPVIDYIGAALLAGALSAIVLVASLGGTTWPWGSSQTILVGAIGLILLGAFVMAERRAQEPILPPALMRNKVFAVGSTLSLVVGFAMFGSITFLPLYFQTVDAATPTQAGLRLLPMMAGLLLTSILSGQLISRRGRYKLFPIFGTAIMALGLLLLSRLNVHTSAFTSAVYLLVLGIGLGLVMQVLVLAVQNAVDYRMLGSATSGVTLFRGIGGSLGAAVFGTIFSSRLTSELKGAFTGPLAHQISGGGRLTGAQVARLRPAVRSTYENAYVHALRPVFLMAAGVAALGFALSWLLPERKLRETAASSHGLDDSLAAPRSPDSLAEIERALTRAIPDQQRERFRARLAERAGLDLSPGATWALVRIGHHGLARARTMAEQNGVPPERIAAVVDELRSRGLVASEDGTAALTDDGRNYAERAITTRQDLLSEALADPSADMDPSVNKLLRSLAEELAGEPPIRAA
jgi:predicted MFS family arabinose efflux permease